MECCDRCGSKLVNKATGRDDYKIYACTNCGATFGKSTLVYTTGSKPQQPKKDWTKIGAYMDKYK